VPRHWLRIRFWPGGHLLLNICTLSRAYLSRSTRRRSDWTFTLCDRSHSVIQQYPGTGHCQIKYHGHCIIRPRFCALSIPTQHPNPREALETVLAAVGVASASGQDLLTYHDRTFQLVRGADVLATVVELCHSRQLSLEAPCILISSHDAMQTARLATCSLLALPRTRDRRLSSLPLLVSCKEAPY
jgi:hypothetical protein